MLTLVSETKLSEYVLIIPSVSVGNLGQLAADILITTFNLEKIGFIRHRNIPPVIGTSINGKGLATECELYASSSLKVAVLQIRSSYGPFVKISDCLLKLCKSFQTVVILTGAYAYERKSIQKIDEPIRYVATDQISKGGLPEFPANWSHLNVSIGESLKIRGSGIADHLFNQCTQEGIAAALVVMYISEGDNRADACYLVNYLDTWLNLREGEQKGAWKAPLSWDSLFGNSIPSGIF